MNYKRLLSLFGFLLFLAISIPSIAQTTTQSLSTVRVDELSDAQVRAFMRQLQATGLSDAQLEQVALARGMRTDEVQKLRQRVEKLKKEDELKQGTATPNPSQSPDGRQLNFETDTVGVSRSPETEAEKALMELRSRIFGADLFRNSNLTFEPNLNMATPQNYVIGPNDALLIDLSGNSQASYNLKVTPEGTINVEYVGIIPIAGLTVEAATSRIRSRMSSIYPGLNGGSVRLNVAIGNIRSIKVILTGEVVKPGTYTLPSLATAFNALYSSGGPTENGSFRAIELIRGGNVVAVLDIYDFLLKGDLKNNLRLQDQDVLRVPVYKSRIEIVGEVKRPGIFELLKNENLSKLLQFAGDFTENAYKARVKVLKNTDIERQIADVTPDRFSTYIPNSGDKFFVDRILERFSNRVSILGAVFRPGQYQLDPGLTLSGLIEKAEGVKEDAFMSRGFITRLQADNQNQIISFDIAKIIDKSTPDIKLIREDIITIPSLFDLKEQFQVTIDGEVRSPGTFNFADKMSLEDLIIMAGGFSSGASEKRIEVSRRVYNSDVNSNQALVAEVFNVDIGKDLNLSGMRFELKPFDIVSVRSSIGYEVQRQVKVEGEVLYPGTYVITNKNERVSDLIKRAGGLTALAYAKGASLKREGKAQANNKNKIDVKDEEKDKLAKLQRLQQTVKDSVDIQQQQEILKNVYVGIDLEKILETPGNVSDLILEESDILRVPKQLQTVKVNGEVLYPVTAIYKKGQGFKGYISDGGGFSDRSLKRRSYVIYANGSVKSTKKLFFFNTYPRVEPGSELFVPKKELQQKMSLQEILGLTTGVASLGAIILGIMNLSK